MRPLAASAALLLLAAPAALAADLPARAPISHPAPARALRLARPAALWLECSPYTAQPITVLYNDPGRTPWTVEPDIALVPLGRAAPFKTRAVYPRGY